MISKRHTSTPSRGEQRSRLFHRISRTHDSGSAGRVLQSVPSVSAALKSRIILPPWARVVLLLRSGIVNAPIPPGGPGRLRATHTAIAPDCCPRRGVTGRGGPHSGCCPVGRIQRNSPNLIYCGGVGAVLYIAMQVLLDEPVGKKLGPVPTPRRRQMGVKENGTRYSLRSTSRSRAEWRIISSEWEHILHDFITSH